MTKSLKNQQTTCCFAKVTFGKKETAGMLVTESADWDAPKPTFSMKTNNKSGDHPELSVAESKVVADMLLRCAEYASQVGPRYIADNPGKVINTV